jgi:protein-S-isoprenylcysteine O-methyltransferase Ste14
MNNWFIIALVAVVLVILILFLIIRNRKDEKELEEKLNQDYHKPQSHDVETEDDQSI